MDTFENLIERAAPNAAGAPEVTAALDTLGAALPSMLRREAAAVRRRRRRRRILTGATGLAVLATAAPAAAGHLGLHTGIFGDDGGHHGEFLNLGSPDALTVIRQYEQEYPLPPGGTWAVLEQRWSSGADANASGTGQAGILEEAAGLESQCQWEGAWLTAHADGDAPAAASAVTVLAQIPTWHVIVAFDADGLGVRLATDVADAARRGDPALPQQVFSVNCTDVKPGT